MDKTSAAMINEIFPWHPDEISGARPARLRSFIDGKWIEAKNYREIVDPVSGEPFIQMPDTSEEELAPFIESLAKCPPPILNVAGPIAVSVRRLATSIGSMVQREPHFRGNESPTSLLSNSKLCIDTFGPPATPLQEMIESIVDWVVAGHRTLSKPTKYQVRDGKF